MSIDAHVTCCTGQRLAFAIRYVLLCFRISVLLGHTEVDDMNDIGGLAVGATDEEVVRLDVTVYHVLLVDRLDSRELETTLVCESTKYAKRNAPSAWPP